MSCNSNFNILYGISWLLVAGFPDMQNDLKRVMAGEMEVVVNEEKSVHVSY